MFNRHRNYSIPEVVTPTEKAKAGDKRKADTKPMAVVAPKRAKQPKVSEEELAEFSEFVNGRFNVS